MDLRTRDVNGKDLIQLLKKAKIICNDAYDCFEKRDAILRELDIVSSARKKRMILGFVLAAIFTVPGTFILSLLFQGNHLHTIIMLYLLCTAIFFVFYFIVICGISLNRREKNIRKNAAKQQEYGENLLKDDTTSLFIIPTKYRFPLALEHMLDLLTTGQAWSLAEVLNQTEEQLRQWESEQNLCQNFIEQVSRLNEIKETGTNLLEN